MLRNRIDPCLDNLETLNCHFPWIPGKDNIRPNEEISLKKENWLENILNFYEDETQYVLAEIFDFKSEFISGKLHVKREDITEKHIFKENMFPYELLVGTNHYVLWYSYNETNINNINKDICIELQNLLKHNNFDFVWYENPKKSVSKITHYQVFWVLI